MGMFKMLERLAAAALRATVKSDKLIFVELRACPKPDMSVALEPHKARAYCRHAGRECKMLQMVMPDGESIICKAADPSSRTDTSSTRKA